MRDHSRLRWPRNDRRFETRLPAEAVRGRYEHYSIGMPLFSFKLYRETWLC